MAGRGFDIIRDVHPRSWSFGLPPSLPLSSEESCAGFVRWDHGPAKDPDPERLNAREFLGVDFAGAVVALCSSIILPDETYTVRSSSIFIKSIEIKICKLSGKSCCSLVSQVCRNVLRDRDVYVSGETQLFVGVPGPAVGFSPIACRNGVDARERYMIGLVGSFRNGSFSHLFSSSKKLRMGRSSR